MVGVADPCAGYLGNSDSSRRVPRTLCRYGVRTEEQLIPSTSYSHPQACRVTDPIAPITAREQKEGGEPIPPFCSLHIHLL